MGYAIGQNSKGETIGYGVEAICAAEGCTTEIDKGLDFTCGGIEGVEGTAGCGGHFCENHLRFGKGVQLCDPCYDAAPPLYPDDEDEALGLSSRIVARALTGLGIPGLEDPQTITFTAPITADGQGWQADISLPSGVPATEVLDRSEQLDRALRAEGFFMRLVRVPAHNTSRLTLVVGDLAGDGKREATVATMPSYSFAPLDAEERAWLMEAHARRRRRYYAQAALAVLIVAGAGMALRNWRAGR